ncbi:hypothetical protein LCGC14_2062330, partial [marine sediment metagenome]
SNTFTERIKNHWRYNRYEGIGFKGGELILKRILHQDEQNMI